MSNPSVVSIILAAGASKRLKSKKSKLLHSALGRPLIDWAVDQAANISKSIVVVVGHQREEVCARIDSIKKDLAVYFAHQTEQKGTADAVQVALQALPSSIDPNTPIFIMGGDSVLLTRETLLNFQTDFVAKKAVLSVITTRVQDPSAYGRILRNPQGGIDKIVEAKDCSPDQLLIDEINTGFYLIGLAQLKEALKEIGNQNRSREFYLTDLVELCRKRGWFVATYLCPTDEAHGVNTREDLARVDEVLRRRTNSYWMSQGVSLIDPLSIRIESSVFLESDTLLEPGVHLKGLTRIGEGSRVGAYSVLEDVKVGTNVQIEAYCHLKESELGDAATIGPFARLRPGSKLEEEVHIGNFVEVKKSRLRKGVKAGHLSYLGDADIGENSNIGAGTITCNYDGFSKHTTLIGKEVFVGSNTSLVAPVKLGDGAIVGAGSVISKDVGAGGLAYERSDQTVISDGAKRFRDKRKKK